MIQPSTATPNSTRWQLSISDQGLVVTEDDSLQQSMIILLTTEPGADPMRPEFGIGLLSMIDQPITQVAAMLRRRSEPQFRQYMPEVDVTGYKVTASDSEPGRITATISWRKRQQNSATVTTSITI